MFELLLTRNGTNGINSIPVSAYEGPAPTSQYALFGGGFYDNYTMVLPNVDKYVYAQNTTSAATALKTSRNSCGAAGDLTAGFFLGGYFRNGAGATVRRLNNVDRYTYSSDVVVATTNLLSLASCSAVGSDTKAVVFGKYVTGYVTSTEEYVYSTLVCSTGTSTSTYADRGIGNTTYGVMSTGWYGAWKLTSDRYIYATSVRNMGTSLTVARSGVATFGNNSFGLFCGGTNNIQTNAVIRSVERYTYTNSVVSTGADLTTLQWYAATGSSSTGLLSGGTSLQKYDYSTETFTVGTNLPSQSLAGRAGVSAAPGWA